MSPEKKQEILDSRDHEDTIIPPGFTPQPENQGKILFLSGPPGAGKSTTGQYLAKQKGWVYYEADCFANSVDPFIPLDVDEPSLAQMKQKAMKGRDVEMLETIKVCFPEFEKMTKQMPYDVENVKPFMKALANLLFGLFIFRSISFFDICHDGGINTLALLAFNFVFLLLLHLLFK